jgi:hypothetical protein
VVVVVVVVVVVIGIGERRTKSVIVLSAVVVVVVVVGEGNSGFLGITTTTTTTTTTAADEGGGHGLSLQRWERERVSNSLGGGKSVVEEHMIHDPQKQCDFTGSERRYGNQWTVGKNGSFDWRRRCACRSSFFFFFFSQSGKHNAHRSSWIQSFKTKCNRLRTKG